MTRALRGAKWLPGILAAAIVAGGCGDRQDAAESNMVTDPIPGAPQVATAGPAEAPPAPAGDGADSGDPHSIKAIMTKLAKGPRSLTPVIGEELKAQSPTWETIQPQAKEFAELAAALGKNDPPKGSEESWTKLTTAYADAASDLQKAVVAKDRDAAMAAHEKLAKSCMECHRAHRPMAPGKGMFPGGGPPGGGPPGPGYPGARPQGGGPGGGPAPGGSPAK